MPAVSVAQRRFFGAELARARSGRKTKTGLGVSTLRKYAGTPAKGLPTRSRVVARMLRRR